MAIIADGRQAIELYRLAWNYVETAGFTGELDWLKARSVSDFTETDLLRETAWVLLCSGFSESVVRRKFEYISLSFCDWECSEAIVASYPACIYAASAAFRNLAKLHAIFETARYIGNVGFDVVKLRLQSDPLVEMQKLPRIGDVTSRHLAKNLGFDVAKPDRHLQRLARKLGYSDVDQLCGQIAEEFETSIAVVDTVLWRYLSAHNPRGPEGKLGAGRGPVQATAGEGLVTHRAGYIGLRRDSTR